MDKWKLLWVGGDTHSIDDTFSKYSGKEVDEVINRFPQIKKPDGSRVIIHHEVLCKNLLSIESVVEGTTRIRRAFTCCTTTEGKVKDTNQMGYKELLKNAVVTVGKPPISSSDDDTSSNDEETNPSSKRPKLTKEKLFTNDNSVKLSCYFQRLEKCHNELCQSYANDRIKNFISALINVILFDYDDETLIWLSTTTKSNQLDALSVKAQHELSNVTADIHGVPDVVVFKKNTDEVLLIAEGKSLEDEESGVHGIGQLCIAMLTAFVKNKGINSIVGFTLSPKNLSVFDIPALTHTQKATIRSHGSVAQDSKKSSLHKLYPLIPFIRLAMQQDNDVFKYNDIEKWLR